jgi:hypothetical protein
VLKITVEGANAGGFIDFKYRPQGQSEEYKDTYESRQINLSEFGGPLSFSGANRARVRLEFYADRDATQLIGFVRLPDNTELRQNGSQLGLFSGSKRIGDDELTVTVETARITGLRIVGGADNGTKIIIPQGFAYTPEVEATIDGTQYFRLPAGSVKLASASPEVQLLQRKTGQPSVSDLNDTLKGTANLTGGTVSLKVTGGKAFPITVDVVEPVAVTSITPFADANGDGVDDTPLPAGQSRQFNALVNYSGTSAVTPPISARVNWTASEGETAALRERGEYTAPSVEEVKVVEITARSVVDDGLSTTLPKTIRVRVVPESEFDVTADGKLVGNRATASRISIPASSSVLPVKVRFDVTDPNDKGAGMTFQVEGGDVNGTREQVTDNSVVYVAPSRAGTFTLRATSKRQTSKSTFITIDVQAKTVGAIIQ